LRQLICSLVRSPGGGVVLARLDRQFAAVLEALESGDRDRARDLIADANGRALLREALGNDWQWERES
jgi:hypothetical protein